MPRSSAPIRMAVIGAGSFGAVHLKTYEQLAREGRVELAGVADRSPEARARCERELGIAVYEDHRALLEQARPDGVSVVTPDHTHREVVCDALEAGCHVLVEKPMDVTVAGCDAMVDLARRKGLLLEVDFHKRYDPYHIALRDAVRAGEIGAPLYGYAWMEDRIELPRDHFPGWAAHSSPIWFLGTHMIDLFSWIIGCPPAVRVFAGGQKVKLPSLGIDTYDAIQAQIEFATGAVLSLNVSWILPDGFEAIVNQGIRVVGSEGIVEIDSQNRGAEACTAGKGQHTWNLGFRMDGTDKFGRPRCRGYGYESIADVVENIEFLRAGGTLEQLKGTYPDGEQGREVTRIAVAIHDSIVSGRTVEL